MSFDWFETAKKLKAIAQAGKAFAKDEYELDRHNQIETITAEIFACHSNLQTDEAKIMLQKDIGYPTPKVDCRGVIFKDDKVLLVREIADGGWTLPGGWCDTGSPASQNVAREIIEESGFEVKVERLLAVYDRDTQGHTPPYPFSIYKMFFLCSITGGKATPSNETSDVDFFEVHDLPPLSVGRTLPHQIEDFYRKYKAGDISCEFD
jgi:ADP-ribose pyrophosphatase YjhB (NUDIX family)